MKQKISPQYAQVEQPFGCEPPMVHCPICGQVTIATDGGDAEQAFKGLVLDMP